MSFSFPYPQMGAVARPSGQGCLTCVHRTYCPAVYWLRRYGIEGGTIDNNMGVQCQSWSNNMADQVKTAPTQDDFDESDYMYLQMIGTEPDRNGLTDVNTGTNRMP